MKSKWDFAPETFNLWKKGKFSLDKATELHSLILTTVRSDYPKKNYSRGYSLTDYILFLAETELNLKVSRSAVNKWIKKIKNNDALNIDDTVDWEDFSRLSSYSLPDLQPRILQSTGWFDRYTAGGNHQISKDKNIESISLPEITPESYRYVKWANYVITNMRVASFLDIDLWVIAKALESRDIYDEDNQDIKDWIKYAPYRNETQEELYLKAIVDGTAAKLKPINFPIVLQAAVERFETQGRMYGSIQGRKHGVMDSDIYESDTERLRARYLVSQFLFAFPTIINKSTGKTDLKQYQLPSLSLRKYYEQYKDLAMESSVFGLLPAYFEMSIEEEVKINEISVKNSLKFSDATDIISEYNNLYYYINKDMF